jgi:formamidopyrimidine-DNA glycosylase
VRCGETVRKIVVSGRGTYVCQRCQRKPRQPRSTRPAAPRGRR